MVTTLIETKLGEIPEDWGVTTIGECCVILDSQRVPLSAEVRRDMKGDYPYYGANGQLDSIDKWIFDEPLILMAEDGGYFDDFRNRPIAYKVTSKCWVNNHAHVLRPKQAYWFDWVFYQLEHMNIIPYINGSTRTKLNQQELVQIRLPVAPLPEQHKIVEILSTVDEAIEKTDAIIQETQQLKKGLMQKLFTEGVGHTKFKETKIGRIPEEWEVVRLGDIIRLSSGKNRPNDYQDCQDEHYLFPIYGGNGVLGYSKEYNWQDNTIILGRVGEYCGAVHRNDGKCWISDNALYIKQFTKAVFDIHFLALSLELRNLNKFKAESGQPLINQSIVYSQRLALPSAEEQRRISATIAEVDTKIETEQAYKAELEQLKKGLMQVLLTGKVRVKV